MDSEQPSKSAAVCLAGLSSKQRIETCRLGREMGVKVAVIGSDAHLADRRQPCCKANSQVVRERILSQSREQRHTYTGRKCAVCETRLIRGEPTEISLDFLITATQLDGIPSIVGFWPGWCGPCRKMAPEFARVAKTLKSKARFVKPNTEAHPQAGNRYGIRGIPLLIAFHGGRRIKRQSGTVSASKIMDWMSSFSTA